jgi:starch phosphorylase
MFNIDSQLVAYFTMEIGLKPEMPTYSGGLGVLAGDTIQAAANMKIPMIVITLLHRKGYFFQKIDDSGLQIEEPVIWPVEDHLDELPNRIQVEIEKRTVAVRAWKYVVTGRSAGTIEVLFLDTDLPDNEDQDRTLTHYLYGGDDRYRLHQEVVLGIGGVRMLRSLGYDNIERFHMNEGHASLLTLELLHEKMAEREDDKIIQEDIENVRRRCVFTTHTPVPAGHDQFPADVVKNTLNDSILDLVHELWLHEGTFNMTYLALNLSHYVNGVAKKHREVTSTMFTGYVVDSITNGVDASRWTSPAFQSLFNKFIPGWLEDNFSLRYALSIPKEEIWAAHTQAKKELVEYVNLEINAGLENDTFTVGFARRATAYKRADLIFSDLDRLRSIVRGSGPLQLIFAGKAHPKDTTGKELIKKIYRAREALRPDVLVAYLPNYNMESAKLLTAGSDIWLNTPIPPLEASGTSGMKAALNGVPSLSVLDGWWIEGCIEGKTGWAIDREQQHETMEDITIRHAEALYAKLEKTILPLFYHQRERFIDIMQHAIALNGSFFNTQRMMQEYMLKAYII